MKSVWCRTNVAEKNFTFIYKWKFNLLVWIDSDEQRLDFLVVKTLEVCIVQNIHESASIQLSSVLNTRNVWWPSGNSFVKIQIFCSHHADELAVMLYSSRCHTQHRMAKNGRVALGRIKKFSNYQLNSNENWTMFNLSNRRSESYQYHDSNFFA